MSKMAVFINRDGTITDEMGYLKEPEKLRLIPRFGKAIRSLNARGILVLTGHGQKSRKRVKPDYTAQDLYQAVKWILAKEQI